MRGASPHAISPTPCYFVKNMIDCIYMYNKQGGSSRFGGKSSFGGSRGGPKKSWGDSRESDGPVTMHKATCAECGNSCEVPFRPMSGKPVFCKDCFGGKRDAQGGDARRDTRNGGYPKRDFAPRESSRPQAEGNRGNEDMKRQLEAMNIKLERLIQTIEKMITIKSAPVVIKEGLKEAVTTAVKTEKVTKKVAKKVAEKVTKKVAKKKTAKK